MLSLLIFWVLVFRVELYFSSETSDKTKRYKFKNGTHQWHRGQAALKRKCLISIEKEMKIYHIDLSTNCRAGQKCSSSCNIWEKSYASPRQYKHRMKWILFREMFVESANIRIIFHKATTDPDGVERCMPVSLCVFFLIKQTIASHKKNLFGIK